MDLGLVGRRALVTGASAGIGRASAAQLAAEGAHVAMVARRADVLEQAAAEIGAATGSRPLTYVADLADPAQVDDVVARAAAALGGLDVLVNCVPAPVWGLFVDHDDAAWEHALQLKFLTYVRAIRAAIPHLAAGGHGVVVNVIGIGGRQPIKEHLAGGAANAALMLLTNGLAKELAAQRIRVVGINPGAVRTERFEAMTAKFVQDDPVDGDAFERDLIASMPTGEILLPQDVADLVAFLASDRARQINGTTITQDGGAMPTV